MEILAIILVLAGVATVLASAVLMLLSSSRKSQVKQRVSTVLKRGSSRQLEQAKQKEQRATPEEILSSTADKASRRKLQITEVFDRSKLSSGELLRGEDLVYFRAGLFTNEDKRKFKRLKIVAPIVSVILTFALAVNYQLPTMIFIAIVVVMLLVGVSYPKIWLERKTENRNDEIMRFLPIVIEQISIGVSSSLDLWSCISSLLETARKRDKINPVVELFVFVEKLIISGLSFSQAVLEVGQASGIHQIKHTFQFLAQCANHGGEITKQLQDLSDSVMNERNTQVEAKITSLPVRATGPLFAIFAGFLALMLAGIFARIVLQLRVL